MDLFLGQCKEEYSLGLLKNVGTVKYAGTMAKVRRTLV